MNGVSTYVVQCCRSIGLDTDWFMRQMSTPSEPWTRDPYQAARFVAKPEAEKWLAKRGHSGCGVEVVGL